MRTKIVTTTAIALLLLLALPVTAGEEDLDGVIGLWPAYNVAADEATPVPEAADPAKPENAEERDDWNFELSLYLWLPTLDLDITTDGGGSSAAGADPNVTIDGPDALTDVLEGAFTGRLEAWYHHLGILVDLGMLSLGDSLKITGAGPKSNTAKADIEIDGRTLFLGLAWRFEGDLPGTHPPRRGFFGDLIGGVRYDSLEISIDVDGRPELSGDETFLEPVLGFRVGYTFCTVFNLSARFEAGGFGIGDAPDHDMLLLLEGRFRVTSWLDIDLGYQWKYLELDLESDGGDIGFDATYHGPWLGLTFMF